MSPAEHLTPEDNKQEPPSKPAPSGKVDQNDPHANLVHAIAEMTLDQFSIILTQVAANPSRYIDIRGYREWMIDSFKQSRVLRDYMDAHANWYGTELREIRRLAN